MIPEGIEVIGSGAFSSNKVMETITLPTTLKVIEETAFEWNSNLKSVTFPEGLQIIGNCAFYECQSLTEIILPGSILKIGVSAFSGCSSVTKLVIPHAVSGTTSYNFLHEVVGDSIIPVGAFSFCNSLEYVEIPEGTIAIGDSAFAHCTGLKNIRIPNTVRTIGNKAFENCSELEELFIPASCVEIGEGAIPRTDIYSMYGWQVSSVKLSRIEVDPQNEALSSVDGILFTKNGDAIIACSSQYSVADYAIPEGVKEIRPGAFEGCEKIKRVVFPQTVEKIGSRAFASMIALEEVVLPHDCPTLESELFMNCINLKHITWPNNVREIAKKCFSHTGIKDLDIPETVECVGREAFSFIKAKKVRLPKSVKDISYSVFVGVPEVEVYDTIDPEAKPAAEYLDDANGFCNGMIGAIGIDQSEGYVACACNARWYDHTIIVRSAVDDSEKYRVRMPKGQKRKVYCTFASSWGKNAEFNFNAVDNIFKDLTADAKIDYAFSRLHWQVGISEEMQNTLNRFVVRNAKEIATHIFKIDSVDDLSLFEPYGIVRKDSVDDRISEASEVKAANCLAYLLDWRNTHLSEKDKGKKAALGLNLDSAPTTKSKKNLLSDELLKIWPAGKGAFGWLTVNGYNGADDDVSVPDMIGESKVEAIGMECFSKHKDKKQLKFLQKELKSVVIPDTVRLIGDRAFKDCSALESVTLPKGLKRITTGMFENCSKLNITIPDSVAIIHAEAFEGCNLNTINIPSSVTDIDSTAFGIVDGKGMPKLEAIEVENNSLCFKSVDGVLFSKDGKVLLKYPQARKSDKYVIPDGVVEIAENAFALASKLKNVVMPDTVEIIGKFAFYHCPKLSKINIPEAVNRIDRFAFEGDESLGDITLIRPDIQLGHCAFYKCKNLTIYAVKNSSVYDYAKEYKVRVKPLENDDKTDSIKTDSSIPKCWKYENGWLKEYSGNDSELVIPASFGDQKVIGLGGSLFEGKKALKKVIISEGIEIISNNVFRGCKSLVEISFPESLRAVGANYTINGYPEGDTPFHRTPWEDKAGNMVIAGKVLVSYRGDEESVTIPEGIKVIGELAFRKKSNLKTVELPSTVEIIGRAAFEGCSSLQQIVLPDGIKSIKTVAFYGCNSLKEIVLPGSLQSFESDSFEGCSSLERIVVDNSQGHFSTGDFCELGCEIVFSNQADAADGFSPKKDEISVGDVIKMGRYPDEIKWIVLDKNGDKALLLSLDCIEQYLFKDDALKDDNRIRKWMNGPFFSSSFTPSEKESLILTDKNHFFLLDEKELQKYFPTADSRKAYATEYAFRNKPYHSITNFYWWLKPLAGKRRAVRDSGSIIGEFNSCDMKYTGMIRPACWVKLS